MQARKKSFANAFALLVAIILPPLVGMQLLWLWHWDFSVPFAYGNPGADEIWQLILTKTLFDTGWVLSNSYLSAPAIAQFYSQSVAQTSALHSVLMLLIKPFQQDPVAAQQIYYILNFSLITLASYIACRLLGMSKVVSICVGLVFSFTSFRMHALFWAFLANYFTIPLSMLVVIWTLTGCLSHVRCEGSDILETPRRRAFICVPLVMLIAVADGYYAFFTLLLMGFAMVLLLIGGGFKRPKALLVPLALTGLLLASAITLQYPLIQHRLAHPEEVDQDVLKQPTDAEVYSTTLKFLIAPPLDHRSARMAAIGKQLIDSGNFNRKFPLPVGSPVILGTLGTLLFAFALLSLFLAQPSRKPENGLAVGVGDGPQTQQANVHAASAVSLFIFLTSITGGVGTLVAFFYPAIRAYERFVLFLVFALLIAGGSAVSGLMKRVSGFGKAAISGSVVLVTLLALLDQTPKDLLSLRTERGQLDRSERFLAERRAVAEIEADVPPGAMIYQFPHSQYLTDNKYYGWGQFGQMRFYLHSKALRWSNGGTKGSPVENWHERLSFLPLPDLVSEMRFVGFSGLAVDRLVVPPAEYATMASTLTSMFGAPRVDDETAKLSFWKFPPSRLKLQYEDDYVHAASVTVEEGFDIDRDSVPRILNKKALAVAIAERNGSYPIVLTRSESPAVFRDGVVLASGFGQTKFGSPSSLQGDVLCEAVANTTIDDRQNLVLTLRNRSAFDWMTGAGPSPLRVVANVVRPDGTYLTDVSIREMSFVPSGESRTVAFPVSRAFDTEKTRGEAQLILDFAILQEGNLWFRSLGNKNCRVTISRTGP